MTDSVQLLRNDALALFNAGVSAANPGLAVTHHLLADGHTIEILLNDGSTRKKNWSKIELIAFGKAACSMAEAAQKIIPTDLLKTPGIAVTNYENIRPIKHIQVIGASHPYPDESGLKAAKMIAQRAARAQADELLLVLLSGGGSALLPSPAASISLSDKMLTTQLLLESGADIHEINCIRKHLSELKGGGLAKTAYPADVHTLVLSDVPGDDLSVIASGPTVADESTFQNAISILQGKNIWYKVPDSIRTHLQQGAEGNIPETPKRNAPFFQNVQHSLVGSNKISLSAVSRAAQEKGYQINKLKQPLTGEARVQAENLAKKAKILQDKGIEKNTALLAGGETTVTVSGTGKGGRNQEMALAFALAAEKFNLNENWVFLSGGTDGKDGITNAAGGIVDSFSISRMQNAAELLDNNDSYHALEQSHDLLITGSTGTNVADLQILLLQPNT